MSVMAAGAIQQPLILAKNWWTDKNKVLTDNTSLIFLTVADTISGASCSTDITTL